MRTSKALWIEKELAPKMEGKVYEHIWVTLIGDKYSVCNDYYIVELGEVYMVNDGTKQFSGDSLEDTYNQCVCIGNYDPSTIYNRKILYYSKEEFKTLLKLN